MKPKHSVYTYYLEQLENLKLTMLKPESRQTVDAALVMLHKQMKKQDRLNRRLLWCAIFAAPGIIIGCIWVLGVSSLVSIILGVLFMFMLMGIYLRSVISSETLLDICDELVRLQLFTYEGVLPEELDY